MPNIFDDTALFTEHANQRFKETFESGVPPLVPSTSSGRQPDTQQLRIKRLEAENKRLKQNLESAENRLSAALAEISKLKETIEESKELAKLSPVKQPDYSTMPKPMMIRHPIKQEGTFKPPILPKKPVLSNNNNALLKPYLEEIKMLRSKLLQYESNDENADVTRIVRFVKSNPVDEAVKRYESSKH